MEEPSKGDLEKGNLEKVEMEIGKVEMNVTNHMNGHSWTMRLRGKIEDYRMFYSDSFFLCFISFILRQNDPPLALVVLLTYKLSYITS